MAIIIISFCPRFQGEHLLCDDDTIQKELNVSIALHEVYNYH